MAEMEDGKMTVVLRQEAISLSNQFADLAHRFENGQVKYSTAAEEFSSIQARALRLAEEILSYVPSQDPRIRVRVQIGNQRVLHSDDLETIGMMPQAFLWPSQPRTVAKRLSELSTYLPEDAA